ncbi:cardiolipin synthase [Ruegeria profundi]|uniref:cardiolipin synthase n=1 Tax=Ruegeria profundi TaxID=1685378 RepID=UPI001CD400A1|nr:cardiolipin synthase [Ruegeria profundi]MCA0928820.1 cardiolipin synthase [Ruegeria profundi]
MTLTFVALFLAQVVTSVRVLTRPNRETTSRIAWVAFVFAFPLIGIGAYFLLGETSIGRRRFARKTAALRKLQNIVEQAGPVSQPGLEELPERFRAVFQFAQTVTLLPVTGGNTAELLSDSEAVTNAMIADIDEATDHVHLLFYIWLTDTTGLRVVEALKRAARRGVTCRAIADDLGSRALIKSDAWREMEVAGVHLARALKVDNPVFHFFDGRLDLRNHRKIVVVDNRVTYCGSQNCADASFSPKPKFAPWVDLMMRFEGAVVEQNQLLFASDWMTYSDEDIGPVLGARIPHPKEGFPAQVIATGPTGRHSAMPDVFCSLIYAAMKELTITTPYFAPNEAILTALRTAGNRGVRCTLVLPARNDNFLVAHAGRSHYASLLEAGVRIMEYPIGLLHAKSLVIDGQLTLIGSANMDR